jgi:GT2 family glycosyltransferase
MTGARPLASIVMTYYERPVQLHWTLQSFAHHGYGADVEVIVADDGSSDAPASRLDVSAYPFRVKLIYLPREQKWYSNPCIPFNRAIAEATGQTVILQNAECFHHGNILSHAKEQLRRRVYLSYGAYSISKQTFDAVSGLPCFADVLRAVRLDDRRVVLDGDDGWYNHSQHRPVAYHFCSALLKQDLDDLGGFDERYARGVGYDDDELIFRIRKNGFDVRIVDDPAVVHQWHYSAGPMSGRAKRLHKRNKKLYQWTTRRGVNPRLVLAVWAATNWLRGRGGGPS